MTLGRFILRLLLGGLFIGHGTQKLFGWFGGSGLEATAQGFESMGIRPARQQALVAGVGEAAGGAMLALGLLTPLGAASISGSMLTAIRRVHAPKGPWITQGGYEYNLIVLGLAFALAERGPGPLSLDRALGIEVSGLPWALAALAAGGAGSQLSHTIAESAAQEAPAPAQAPEQQPTPAAV
jgi:putative oxidoreductase